MKKLSLLLGVLFSLNAYALPNAADKFSSLLPYGSYEGEDCRVRVTRTITNNIKVSVVNPMYKMEYVIQKNQFYRHFPGQYFAVYTDKKNQNEIDRSYLFMSYSEKGINVLVGKVLYSPYESYERNVECIIN